MKESIYMIPLNDSFDNKELCPFCFLEKKLENDMVEYCIGPSMMEPDSREESNKTGFCREHLDMMLAKNNRLSLALLLSTHMEFVKSKIAEYDKCLSKSSLFKKPDFSAVKSCTNGCVICSRINYDMHRYYGTFFYMYAKTAEFREKAQACDNLCVSHGSALLQCAPPKSEDAAKTVCSMLLKRLDTDVSELKAFIDLFDYRSKGSDPSAHKDAVPDAIEHLG